MGNFLYMSSFKNILYQFYQKRVLLIEPIYTQNFDESDRYWSSSVKITLNGSTVSFTSNNMKRKNTADCDAARLAIEYINETIRSEITETSKRMIDYKVNDRNNVYVLVDYENYTKISHLLKREDIELLNFVGHCSHHSDRKEVSFVVYSSIKDAVDHAIGFFAGVLVTKYIELETNHDLHIFVLTRDHFGSALADFSNDYDNVNIYHCASEQKCIDMIDSLIP